MPLILWIGIGLVLIIIAAFLVVRLKGARPVLEQQKPSETKHPEISAKVEEKLTPKSRKFSSAIKSWIPLLQTKTRDRAKWEEVLITSDMGPRLTDSLLAELEKSSEEPLNFLKKRLADLIASAESQNSPWKDQKPWVAFIVGVNGVGKTTSIVKLAHFFLQAGFKVGVVGADTFRKAAIEQLERGVKRVGAEFFTVTGAGETEGADPSAVIFDGLKKFSSLDVILVDTSGRLHSKKNLMEELKKMKRVSEKALAGTPHDIWLVVDATLGQNAVTQGKSFHEAVGLTGLILTKMDGLSRGGTVFQLYDELRVPIRFLGVGESENDLKSFKTLDFIEDLFDLEPTSS